VELEKKGNRKLTDWEESRLFYNLILSLHMLFQEGEMGERKERGAGGVFLFLSRFSWEGEENPEIVHLVCYFAISLKEKKKGGGGDRPLSVFSREEALFVLLIFSLVAEGVRGRGRESALVLSL